MPDDHQNENAAFAARLVEVCRDRGFRAQLRRYWSPATYHHALPVLGRLGALDHAPKTITAALYAVHAGDRSSADAGPDGPSIGRAALQLAKGSVTEDMERHFRRILACRDLPALGECLFRFIKRLEREGIPLDYAQLLSDLRQFSRHSAKVKTRWSLHFWQAE